jgi:hypothetical protein
MPQSYTSNITGSGTIGVFGFPTWAGQFQTNVRIKTADTSSYTFQTTQDNILALNGQGIPTFSATTADWVTVSTGSSSSSFSLTAPVVGGRVTFSANSSTSVITVTITSVQPSVNA